VRQQELREGIYDAIEEYFESIEMPQLKGCLLPPYEGADGDGIDRAMGLAYRRITEATRQISRIAVRLGYIQKEGNK
jgi:hypothetical protein